MTVISSHAFSIDIPGYTKYVHNGELRLQNQLRERIAAQPSDAGRFTTSMQTDACWSHALSEHRSTRRFLSACVDLCACTFAAANATTDTVEFEFDGNVLVGPTTGPHKYAANMNLFWGLLIGAALQKTRQVDTLLAHDTSHFPGGNPKGFQVALAQGMSAWLKGEERWKDDFEYAQFLTSPENLRDYSLGEVQQYTNIIPVFHAIEAGSQQAFTAALMDAVKGHKKYHGRGQRAKMCTSVLAIYASCAAAIGVQRGLVFEIESSYAPRWLVEGEQP